MLDPVSTVFCGHFIHVLHIFGGIHENGSAKAHADRSRADPEKTAATRQIVRREVGAKWAKFSEQDLSALKDRDDLVSQVVSRYGVEKSEAQRDVDSVLKGARFDSAAQPAGNPAREHRRHRGSLARLWLKLARLWLKTAISMKGIDRWCDKTARP